MAKSIGTVLLAMDTSLQYGLKSKETSGGTILGIKGIEAMTPGSNRGCLENRGIPANS